LADQNHDGVVLHGWLPDGRRLLYQISKRLYTVPAPRPDEAQDRTTYRLASATRIYSTPHPWLEGRRVYFTIPAGWKAKHLPPDEKNYPPGWWVEQWEKAGISWRFRPKHTGASGEQVYFDFDIAMEPGSHSDTWRYGNARDLHGRYGVSGFQQVMASDNPGWEIRWGILRVPDQKAPNYIRTARSLYLVCSATYPTKWRDTVTPVIDALVRNCSIHR
jgi:hypothetical protein